MKPAHSLLALLGMMLGAFSPAQADQPAAINPLLNKTTDVSTQWRITASPYAWASGLTGKVGQFGGPPIKVNSSFSDIISNLDIAFMGALEARYGHFSLLADVMYAKLSAGHDSRHVSLLSQRTDIRSESFSGFFGAGYGLLNSDRWHLDVIGGARVWRASTTLSWTGGLLDGHSQRDSATWIDAVAGLRGHYALNEHWYLTGWGMVGAGQAKLDWDATAAVAYQFKSHLSAVVGYRAMGVDFTRGDFVYNVTQHGPILGLTYRF